VGKDIYVGVAPRRDWFISPEKNLKVLPRVFGGTTKETTELMRNVLSLICDNLVPAPDHRHAEIVKGIENAYRHMEITLANQLSLAYPDLDMTEILRLVGTKWNMGTYYPSFGTGGYCIPLASKYVISGTKYPQNLTLLNETIKFDSKMPIIVAESLIKRGAKNVGILGLAYKGDLKVHILSPTIKIVRLLKERGVNVKVHDPYYTEEEIKKIVDVETFSYPEGLKEFDTILIVAGHLLYKSTPEKVLIENLKNCRLILDNLEKAWRRIDFSKYGIKYYVAGESGWLVTS
ncbi:MAG: UDP binding domain-containing protein, partial [Candidatus Aenigmatarchaeota archaeon]